MLMMCLYGLFCFWHKVINRPCDPGVGWLKFIINILETFVRGIESEEKATAVNNNRLTYLGTHIGDVGNAMTMMQYYEILCLSNCESRS